MLAEAGRRQGGLGTCRRKRLEATGIVGIQNEPRKKLVINVFSFLVSVEIDWKSLNGTGFGTTKLVHDHETMFCSLGH